MCAAHRANPLAAGSLAESGPAAEVEQLLAQVGVAYSVIRPTVVFGGQDVLVNNIAWLLRRFPVFAIPGRGAHRVRSVFVDDLACLCVDRASTEGIRSSMRSDLTF
jgi:uncharacterized protein YbjT (DUF2867 family)